MRIGEGGIGTGIRWISVYVKGGGGLPATQLQLLTPSVQGNQLNVFASLVPARRVLQKYNR